MSSLLANCDLLARLLAQVLLNSLWQGALIVALVLLLLRTLRHLSATTRHAVWLLALFAVAALPLLTATMPRRASPAALPATESVVSVSTTPAAVITAADDNRQATFSKQTAPRADDSVSSGTLQSERSLATVADVSPEIRLTAITKSLTVALPDAEAGRFEQWSRNLLGGHLPLLLTALWLVIAALLLIQVLRSYVSLRVLRSSLAPLAEAEQQRLMRVAAGFGISRRVRLGWSDKAAMPLTMGWLRPVIILPPGLTAELSAAECEAVIAHELAHIKRCDFLTRLAQRLVQAVLFFHPAVWLIGRQLAIERELACDDWAVRLTGEPRRYAGSLARLAEMLVEGRSFAAAAGIIFGRHIVSRRIEMILDHQRNADTFVSKLPLSCAAGLVLTALCVCSYFSPVIAVPLQQRPATAQQPKAPATPAPLVAAQPAKPQTPKAPAGTPAAPVAPSAPAAVMAEAIDELPAPAAALPAEPAEILSATAPVAAMVWTAGQQTPAPAQAPMAVTPWPQEPGTPLAVVADTIGGNRQPAIPEAELLSVLTDIARKDSDPAVRSEALRGIYRLRSDASINALIQIYDAMTDAKVKGEIISYLIRRNGDNAKAISKLVSIVKTEKDEDLRRQALRHLLYVKGDEGATHLIEIYDSLQDAKVKQTVIRYLAANKSKKALDKLTQIAKSDPDPAIRQMAIRALAGMDGPFPFELLETPRFGISRGIGQASGFGETFSVQPAPAEASAGTVSATSISPLNSYYRRRAELNAQLKQLRASYTENHPKVTDVKAQIEALDQEIERLRGR
ncbi:MAG: M56 family metallopeptidase [Blastocatellia bacterium]